MDNRSHKPLADTQKEFTAHLRDPDRHPAPTDLDKRRVAVYRRLFYNNIHSLVSANFPVLKTVLDRDAWHHLVRDFCVEHRAQTPYFPEFAREFIRYLRDVRGEREEDPPFLLELAHYEWVELALALDTHEIDEVAADPNGDLLAGVPVVSPVAWLLGYSFPVHRIRPDFQPREPGRKMVHLVVYRDRDGHVRFLELNPTSARLLSLLKENEERTGLDCLEVISEEMAHPQPQTVIDGGMQVLEDLRRRDVLLGTNP